MTRLRYRLLHALCRILSPEMISDSGFYLISQSEVRPMKQSDYLEMKRLASHIHCGVHGEEAKNNFDSAALAYELTRSGLV